MNSSSRDHEHTTSIALDGDAAADALDFVRRVAAVPLERLDLSYLATNVLYARGSLSRELRREAVIAIKTLREILNDAREQPSSAEQVSGDSSRDDLKPYEAEVGERQP